MSATVAKAEHFAKQGECNNVACLTRHTSKEACNGNVRRGLFNIVAPSTSHRFLLNSNWFTRLILSSDILLHHFDRIGLDRIGFDLIGSDWIGSNWIGLDRIRSKLGKKGRGDLDTMI